jgi:hypothetical protein
LGRVKAASKHDDKIDPRKDVSNSSPQSPDNDKELDSDDVQHQEATWKLNGNSSKNDTNSSSLSYFSRNIITISLDDQVILLRTLVILLRT